MPVSAGANRPKKKTHFLSGGPHLHPIFHSWRASRVCTTAKSTANGRSERPWTKTSAGSCKEPFGPCSISTRRSNSEQRLANSFCRGNRTHDLHTNLSQSSQDRIVSRKGTTANQGGITSADSMPVKKCQLVHCYQRARKHQPNCWPAFNVCTAHIGGTAKRTSFSMDSFNWRWPPTLH